MLTEQSLPELLSTVAARRPVFHSEADLQHTLAWEMQKRDPQATIRLEARPERRVHLDILTRVQERELGIEIKYLTKTWSGLHDGERFDLLNQGAQDIRAYDCVKDLARLERFSDARPGSRGLALVVTNDPNFWSVRRSTKLTNADAFRLHEGRVLTGVRSWGPRTGPGTMKGREADLSLRGAYECRWQDFSEVGDEGSSSRFRYLALWVDPVG